MKRTTEQQKLLKIRQLNQALINVPTGSASSSGIGKVISPSSRLTLLLSSSKAIDHSAKRSVLPLDNTSAFNATSERRVAQGGMAMLQALKPQARSDLGPSCHEKLFTS